MLIVAGPPGNGDGAGAPTNNTIGGFTATPGTGAGNLISGNTGAGVEITGTGTTGNVVQGDLIGLNATAGSVPVGNGGHGVEIDSGASGNFVGGPGFKGGQNVISGNHGAGVYITDPGTDSNVVAGNFIGTNAAGTAAVANGASGVVLVNYAADNTIGGASATDRNLISGNAQAGIAFVSFAAGNVAQGNWVGLSAAGSAAIPNLAGIGFVDGAGANSAIGNVISGNRSAGIFIGPFNTPVGADGELIQGNLIGTDPGGTIAVGNTGPGVEIEGGSWDNTIGGTSAGSGNVISGNTGDGVEISARARPATWLQATGSARMPPAPPCWQIPATASISSRRRSTPSAAPQWARATSSLATQTASRSMTRPASSSRAT